MKHIFDENYFQSMNYEIFSQGKDYFEDEEGERFLISVLLYILYNTEI